MGEICSQIVFTWRIYITYFTRIIKTVLKVVLRKYSRCRTVVVQLRCHLKDLIRQGLGFRLQIQIIRMIPTNNNKCNHHKQGNTRMPFSKMQSFCQSWTHHNINWMKSFSLTIRVFRVRIFIEPFLWWIQPQKPVDLISKIQTRRVKIHFSHRI